MTEPIFVNDKDDITGRIHDHRDATIADLERRLAEVTEILNLQRPRMEAAVAMWRAAHPGQEIATPDLGRLLEWLMEGRRDGDRLRRLATEAAITMEQIEPSSCITIKESDRIERARKLLRDAARGGGK